MISSDGEVRANALQKQLDELPAGEHKELAEVRAELEVTRASLAKYEKVLGPIGWSWRCSDCTMERSRSPHGFIWIR